MSVTANHIPKKLIQSEQAVSSMTDMELDKLLLVKRFAAEWFLTALEWGFVWSGLCHETRLVPRPTELQTLAEPPEVL